MLSVPKSLEHRNHGMENILLERNKAFGIPGKMQNKINAD
jgi:hypothetical protein